MNSPLTLFITLIGGIMPSLLWLWFWLQEDRKHPEPRRRIILSFLCGMLAVLLVFIPEELLYRFFGDTINIATLLSWAATEEIFKFAAAYWSALRKSPDYDEPIDSIIYLISAALGFSAMENSFFLLKFIGSSSLTQSIVSGNLRFVGATLLHVLSSATIGIFLAFAFYKDKKTRRNLLFTGLAASIILHAIFNYFIMEAGNVSRTLVFGGVWLCVIALILIIEKIKALKFN